jgi:hypothetical protein
MQILLSGVQPSYCMKLIFPRPIQFSLSPFLSVSYICVEPYGASITCFIFNCRQCRQQLSTVIESSSLFSCCDGIKTSHSYSECRIVRTQLTTERAQAVRVSYESILSCGSTEFCFHPLRRSLVYCVYGHSIFHEASRWLLLPCLVVL